jgi:hypothetical protein
MCRLSFAWFRLVLLAVLLAGCQSGLAPGATPTVLPAPSAAPVAAPTTVPATAGAVAGSQLSTGGTAVPSALSLATDNPGPAASVTPASISAPTASASFTDSLAAPWNDWSFYTSSLRPPADLEGAGLSPATSVLTGMTQYHLGLSLAGRMDRLDGQERVRYTNRSATVLEAIYLHLFPNLNGDGMTVSDVRVAGQPVQTALESEDSLLRVLLPDPLGPGKSVEVSLAFSDPIPAGKEVGNYGEFAWKDGVLALAGFYPTVAVYDSAGWHRERPSTQGDVLFADASLFDVTLRSPADLTVAATGQTQEQRDNRDGTVTWRLVGGPLRDFNIVASADYVKSTTQVGDVAVNSYAVSADAASGEKALAWAAAALDVYQKAFGPYPYCELDVTETPTSAGGIEYPGLIVVAQALYRSPERISSFEGATAHEVSHQWWAMVVGDDQVNNPWLDESTAQYSTGLYFTSRYGEAAGRNYRRADWQGRWDRVHDEPKPIGLPVAAYEGGEYSAIVYGRGPLFLQALETQIGTDKMTAFLRRYYQQCAWGVATPADFQKLAEEVSGQNLQALFDKWVYPAQ